MIKFNPELILGKPKEQILWAVYNMEASSNPDKKRAKKIPRDPLTGSPVKVNEPGAGSDFEICRKAVAEGRFDGVSLILTANDPYTGLDLDDCVDPTSGEILPWAKAIVERLGSYTEISPSGTGLRILIRAKLPPGGRHKGIIEMYDSGRALTVTGNHLEGTPTEIHDRQEEIEELHAEIFGPQVEPKPTPPSEPTATFTSDEIKARLEKAFTSSNGPSIRALHKGQWESLGYPSQSEADQALCNHLAFWFAKDPAAIDAAFRDSGLLRKKWREPRGPDGATYGDITIANAIKVTKEVYEEPEIPPFIEEMNAKHAVMLNGGKCVIMNQVEGPTGEKDISFSSISDLNNFYANKMVPPECLSIAGDTTISKAWLQSRYRREYKGLAFEPAHPGDVNGHFNIFQGLAVIPKPGTWGHFRNHILEVISRGDKNIFDYVMAWLADGVQNIGKHRPGVAIVLRGGQGTGKGSFVNTYGSIFGAHFIPITNQRQLTGNFNSHLKGGLLTFLDEALWAGQKSAEGTLKAMITEDFQMIEQKGRDAFRIRNHSRYIMASNNEWVVPAGMDERRFFVLDVSDAKARDHAYFEAIRNEMDNGGREAMLHDLLAYDLTGINLRDFPKTEALLDQKINSMDTVAKFWFERLREGSLVEGGSTWEEFVPTSTLYEGYLAFQRQTSGARHRLSDGEFSKQIRKYCPKVERKKKTLPMTGKRPWCLVFPGLGECREDFARSIQAEINWEGI